MVGKQLGITATPVVASPEGGNKPTGPTASHPSVTVGKQEGLGLHDAPIQVPHGLLDDYVPPKAQGDQPASCECTVTCTAWHREQLRHPSVDAALGHRERLDELVLTAGVGG